MATQQIIVQGRFNFDIGAAKAQLSQLQNSFKNLTVSNNIKSQFDNIVKSSQTLLQQLEQIQGKTTFNSKDIQSADSAVKQYQKTIENLDNLIIKTGNDTKTAFNSPSAKQLQQDLTTLQNQVKLIGGTGKQFISTLGLSFKDVGISATQASEFINGFLRNIEKGASVGSAFNSLKASLKSLELDGTKTKAVYDALKAALQNAGLTSDMLATKQEKIVSIQQQLSSQVNKVTSEMRNQTSALYQLGKTGSSGLKQLENEYSRLAIRQREVSQLTTTMNYAFSAMSGFYLLRRGVTETIQTMNELDEAMKEIAVVSDYTIGDLWKKFDQFTDSASQMGVRTVEAINSIALFIQQGLGETAAKAVSESTLRMAAVAGISGDVASDIMTAALRGFEIDPSKAETINDVFTQLAAITAADVQEIGSAVQRTASIANSAGLGLEATATYLAKAIEVTREPSESLGTALKTIVARFQELKKPISDAAGVVDEDLLPSANRVEAALNTVGISLFNEKGQFRDLEQIFMDLGEKWDGLDRNTQRYIATIASGSRQQSRFIAMMANHSRTTELLEEAYGSAGKGMEQFEKTQDSLTFKINVLKNAWDSFRISIIDTTLFKGLIDGVGKVITLITDLTSSLGAFGGVINFALIIGGFLAIRGVVLTFSRTLTDSVARTKAQTDVLGTSIDKVSKKSLSPLIKQFNSIGTSADKGKTSINSIVTSLSKVNNAASRVKIGEMLVANLNKSVSQLSGQGLRLGNIFIKSFQKAVKSGNVTMMNKSLTKLQGLGINVTSAMNTTGNSLQRMGLFASRTAGKLGNLGLIFSSLPGPAGALGSALFTASIAMEGLGGLLPTLKLGFDGLKLSIGGTAAVTALLTTANQAVVIAEGKVIEAETYLASLRNSEIVSAELLVAAENQLTAAKAQHTAATEALAAAEAKAAVASKLITAAPYVAIAVALVSIIVAINKVSKSHKELAKNASKAYEDIKQHITDVTTKISDLNTLQDEFNNLTRGTTAWNEKLLEVNSTILELLQIAPQLSKSVSFQDGEIKINEADLENFQKTLIDIQNKGFLNTLAANASIAASKAIEYGDMGYGNLSVNSVSDYITKNADEFEELTYHQQQVVLEYQKALQLQQSTYNILASAISEEKELLESNYGNKISQQITDSILQAQKEANSIGFGFNNIQVSKADYEDYIKKNFGGELSGFGYAWGTDVEYTVNGESKTVNREAVQTAIIQNKLLEDELKLVNELTTAYDTLGDMFSEKNIKKSAFEEFINTGVINDDLLITDLDIEIDKESVEEMIKGLSKETQDMLREEYGSDLSEGILKELKEAQEAAQNDLQVFIDEWYKGIKGIKGKIKQTEKLTFDSMSEILTGNGSEYVDDLIATYVYIEDSAEDMAETLKTASNISFSSSIYSARDLEKAIEGADGASKQFFEGLQERNASFISTTAQVREIINEFSEDSNLADPITELIKEGKKITSTKIKELAKSSDKLNTILKRGVISTRALANTLNLLNNEKLVEMGLQLTNIDEGFLKLIEGVNNFGSAVDEATDYWENFEKELSDSAPFDAATSLIEDLGEEIEKGRWFSTDVLQVLGEFFNVDILKEVLESNDPTGLIEDYYNRLKLATESEGLSFFYEIDEFMANTGNPLGNFFTPTEEGFDIAKGQFDEFIEYLNNSYLPEEIESKFGGSINSLDDIAKAMAEKSGTDYSEEWWKAMLTNYGSHSPEWQVEVNKLGLEEGISEMLYTHTFNDKIYLTKDQLLLYRQALIELGLTAEEVDKALNQAFKDRESQIEIVNGDIKGQEIIDMSNIEEFESYEDKVRAFLKEIGEASGNELFINDENYLNNLVGFLKEGFFEYENGLGITEEIITSMLEKMGFLPEQIAMILPAITDQLNSIEKVQVIDTETFNEEMIASAMFIGEAVSAALNNTDFDIDNAIAKVQEKINDSVLKVDAETTTDESEINEYVTASGEISNNGATLLEETGAELKTGADEVNTASENLVSSSTIFGEAGAAFLEKMIKVYNLFTALNPIKIAYNLGNNILSKLTGNKDGGTVYPRYSSGSNRITAGPALVGEAGAEIIQRAQGGYQLAQGPVQTILNPGDIVYNAKETKEILRGSNLKDEKPRFATGYWTQTSRENAKGQTVTTTSGIEDVADSIADANEESGEWENTLDRLYNMFERIDSLTQKATIANRAYEKALRDTVQTTQDLRKYTIDELASLKAQQAAQQGVIDFRKREIQRILSTNASLARYATYDFNTMEIQIDWQAINSITDVGTGEAVDSYIEQLEEMQDSIDDATDELYDIEDAIEEIMERGREEYLDLENTLYDALVEREQKIIDLFTDMSDALNESNNKIVEAIREGVEETRSLREQNKALADLEAKQRRLALLKSNVSGANALDILSLQEEINNAQQSYTDSLIDKAIEQLEKGNEIAQTQRQLQIQLMQAQLDYNEANGYYWQQVMPIIADARDSAGNIIDSSTMMSLLMESSDWAKMSQAGREAWKQDLYEDLQKAFVWLDIDSDIAALQNAVTAASSAEIAAINNMANSVTAAINATKVTTTTTTSTSSGSTSSSSSSSGSSGSKAVYNLQLYLNSLGAGLTADGLWGPLTSAAYTKYYNMYSALKTTTAYAIATALKNLKNATQYEQGGLVNTTGLQMLHGSKDKPEIVLNAVDSANFIQLRDILSEVLKGTSNTSNSSSTATVQNFNIDIQVDKIADDYDVDDMVARMKQTIVNDARYRNAQILRR